MSNQAIYSRQEMQTQKVGSTPNALEAEKGLAAIVLNYPEQSAAEISRIGFCIDDIFDPLIKAVIQCCMDMTSRGVAFDIRVVYESIKKHFAHLEFHVLSDLYTNIASPSALKHYCDIIKEKACLRWLQAIARKVFLDVDEGEFDSTEISAEVAAQVESLSSRIAPPSVVDTRALLLDAANRYEKGEDMTSIIKTGFQKVDNLTPIRYGDFLIIGGETKSGKTTLALNIVANYITQNEL